MAPASPATQTYVSPGTGYGPPGSVSPFSPVATAPPTGSYGYALPPPSPGLDPYATPGVAPAPLFVQDPYFDYGASGIPMAAMTKFLQDIRMDYHWFAGNGQHQLGINDFDVSATFALPFLGNPNTPLLVTPGFGLQLWEGPVSVLSSPPNDPAAADLPAQTWDGYLDTAWKPQISPAFGGDLSFRVGIYSDFNTVTTNSIRFTGTALGVISLSPSVKIKAGIWYIDRLQIKLLPAGGIVWTPNPEVEFNILFPNPKIRKKLMNFGSVEWWIYGSGDYGGGSWTIKRASIPGISDPLVAGNNDAFDYDDIRVAAGLEFFTPRHLNGWFEVGGAFSRQIHYRSGLPDNFYPTNALFLLRRIGLLKTKTVDNPRSALFPRSGVGTHVLDAPASLGAAPGNTWGATDGLSIRVPCTAGQASSGTPYYSRLIGAQVVLLLFVLPAIAFAQVVRLPAVLPEEQNYPATPAPYGFDPSYAGPSDSLFPSPIGRGAGGEGESVFPGKLVPHPDSSAKFSHRLARRFRPALPSRRSATCARASFSGRFSTVLGCRARPAAAVLGKTIWRPSSSSRCRVPRPICRW